MADSGAGASPIQATPRKVLVVDDEEGVRSLLRLLFDAEPMFDIVAEAEDGVEALSLAMLHRPDYVILDYSMPRMNGEEAARVLRGIQTSCCIVAFSSIVTERPDWADAHLGKDEFEQLVPLLKELEETRCRVAS